VILASFGQKNPRLLAVLDTEDATKEAVSCVGKASIESSP
jgi:hypothetical protein